MTGREEDVDLLNWPARGFTSWRKKRFRPGISDQYAMLRVLAQKEPGFLLKKGKKKDL